VRQVVVRRLQDGAELIRLPRVDGKPWYVPLSFSPDGNYLQIRYTENGDAGYTDVWHLARNERVFHQPTRSIAAAFHPDGRRFFFSPVGGGLGVWDLVAQHELPSVPLKAPAPLTFLFDACGEKLAVNDGTQHRIEILDLRSGKVLHEWTDEAAGRQAMSWSDNGRWLTTGEGTGRIYVRDLTTANVTSVLPAHVSTITGTQFIPGSRMLASSSWDVTMRFWDVSTGDLLLSSMRGLLLGVSPDGSRVAYQDGESLHEAELARDQEVRVLNPASVGNKPEEFTGADRVFAAGFSPDGQLLGVGTRHGLSLYESATLELLAELPCGPCESLIFDDDGGCLITSGAWGVNRWPIRPPSAARSGLMEIGPPTLLHRFRGDASWQVASWLPGKQQLAVLDNVWGRLLLLDSSARRSTRFPTRELPNKQLTPMTALAISPDGRWAAAGGWRRGGIAIWDIAAGKLVQVLTPVDNPGELSSFVAFSPDGKYLFASCLFARQGYYRWEVGTWKRSVFLQSVEHPSDSPPVVSADGKMVAVRVDRQKIRLADPGTGRTIAHISGPLKETATPIAFSPDGTLLVGQSSRNTAIVWDLRRIRDKLRSLDLDWDQPPFPERAADAGKSRSVAPTRTIRVAGEAVNASARFASIEKRLAQNPDDADALEERGWIYREIGRYADALADHEKSQRLTPDPRVDNYHLTVALNDLAWVYANGAASDRNPHEAVVLARRATALRPDIFNGFNTLGVALYRAARYAEAVPNLEKSLANNLEGYEGYDYFFLAMAHHRLGHVRAATEYFKAGADWLNRQYLNATLKQELLGIKAEAEETLAQPPGELPARVFARE
jgi:WD40 repeat protein